MIRPTLSDDRPALLAIAAAIGLTPEEQDQLDAMLTDYFSADHQDDFFWLTDDDNGPVGVAYCELERMTDQTWNLLLIAIHPDYQNQGRGSRLLHHVEDVLQARGGRLLLVETLASFEQARAFYLKCGFEEEACIRDFYEAGGDKIVFRKPLDPAPGPV